MKNPVFFTVGLSIALAIVGCNSELPLDNKTQLAGDDDLFFPTQELILTNDEEDLEALIAGSFLSWWQIHNQNGPEALIVTADALTCSWGNFGMRDLSSEPRAAFPNERSYQYIRHIEDPWYETYRAISAANEGLHAISINSDTLGADTPRAQAFAKLVQGLSYGYLACFFDQAFIIDENDDLDTFDFVFSPYNEVMTAAITMLEEAIAIMSANVFTLPSSWINGLTLTNVDLQKVAHAYIARYLAQVARNPAERAAVDWSTVRQHAEQGITTAFAPFGDDDQWWHSMQWFHNDRGATWARMDYKLIGPSDKSDAYQDWLNTPVENRTEFDMDTDDLRLWDGTLDGDGNQNPGTYAGNWGPSPFPPARGTYHFSKYGYYRYEDFKIGGAIGPMPIFLPEELDLLKAEALLWTAGDLNEVAALINNTRVTNGGYPPAMAADGAGSVDDTRSPLPGASLWAMLKYEKHIEVLMTGAGVEFFDNRGWGDLTTNTPIHFPVPARELQFLLILPYTFGGGGDGSAPN